LDHGFQLSEAIQVRVYKLCFLANLTCCLLQFGNRSIEDEGEVSVLKGVLDEHYKAACDQVKESSAQEESNLQGDNVFGIFLRQHQL
jgi:hypothetical protein